MRCSLIFDVSFKTESGDDGEFWIQKEFEFLIRPMVGDELTVCGDSNFTITNVYYDVDTGVIEVGFDCGPSMGEVQRWINEGFKLYANGLKFPVPANLVW